MSDAHVSDLCHRCRRPAHYPDSRGRPICRHCDPLSLSFSPREIVEQPSERVSFMFALLDLVHSAQPAEWAAEGNTQAAEEWERRLVKLLEEYGP